MKGFIDFNTMRVKFGGELSKPHNNLTAEAIKIPPFEYQVTERADAGGGCYYNYSETVTRTEDNMYAIVKDGLCIGVMVAYSGNTHPSELRLLGKKTGTPSAVYAFLNANKLPYYTHYRKEKQKLILPLENANTVTA